MINESDVEIIKKHYHARGHNNDYRKYNLGFGFIHYALIRNLRAEKILVVGSQRGYVPAICALACRHERVGKVDFVDKGCEIDDENSWGGVGIWKEATEDYWKPLGVEDYIKLYVMSTEEFGKKISELKGVWGLYDYIYIDGDHSYEGVRRDYRLFWPYLRDDGLMVFHDVLVDKVTDYGRCGVKRFWQELKREKRGCLTIDYDAGLGILQK